MAKVARYRRRRSRQPWIYRRTNIFGLTRYRLIKLSPIVLFALILTFSKAQNLIREREDTVQTNISEKEDTVQTNLQTAISVIDGDTVNSGGYIYRLVGFDTPEKGDLAHCTHERELGAAATRRLKQIIPEGDPVLKRVLCSCPPETEGTRKCNYGRRCGTLEVDGRDVGSILINEGLAHAYVCGATGCPRKQSWCD